MNGKYVTFGSLSDFTNIIQRQSCHSKHFTWRREEKIKEKKKEKQIERMNGKKEDR